MLYNQALFSDCVIPTDEKNPLIPINVCRTRMHIGCRVFFIHYTNAKCVNISNSNRLITRSSFKNHCGFANGQCVYIFGIPT